jgi:hypothetical protein
MSTFCNVARKTRELKIKGISCGRIHSLNLVSEEFIDYTNKWTGERFTNARSKVLDSILERMKG